MDPPSYSTLGVASSEQHRRLAAQALGANVSNEDHALGVALLAEVKTLDAAAIADVNPAVQELRLVDVAERDVGETVEQACLVEDDVFLRRSGETASL